MAHNFRGEFVFTWKIENFSMLPHQENEKLVSPTFVVEMLGKTEWCLCLYPKGDEREESFNHISICLCRVDFDKNTCASKVGFAFVLESEDSKLEKTIATESYLFDVDMKDRGYGYPAFQTMDYVYDKKRRFLTQDVLTIRCHIWSTEDNCEDPVISLKSTAVSNNFEKRCSAVTRVEVQKRTLTWPITKINELKESQEKISIDLVNSLKDSSALKLSFCIGKDSEYSHIEIIQTRSSKRQKTLFVKCKISVVSADKASMDAKEDSHLFSSNLDEIWHFPDFIKTDALNKGNYIFVDNTMFLHCEFLFSCKGRAYYSELPSMYMHAAFRTKADSVITQLVGNIQQLFVSKKFCDVEVRAGGKTFPSHKVILCAQSPVFSAMFENDLKEKKSCVIEITDMDSETTERMLTFMYSDAMEKNLSTKEVCKLYSAADKYEVVPLQRQCSLMLASALSVQSICDVLVTADRYQDNFLWIHINSFLCIHSRETFHSSEWNTFMDDYPELARETMINIFMK